MMRFFDKIKEWLLARIGRKRKPAGDFKRRRRYRVSVTNMLSLRVVMEYTAPRGEMWLTAISLFFLIGLLWLCAFIYTPLRNVLPAKMQTDLRDEYVDLSIRLDSALAVARITDAYTQNIMAILGDSVDADQLRQAKEGAVPQPLPLDSLIDASAAERSFVSRFEDSERYSLSVLSPIAAEGMTFYPPVSGVVGEERVSEAGIPAMMLRPGRSTPVSAVYRGTVVSTYFTTGKGITVIVQHPNDFVSVYTGLAEAFVSRGDKVAAGTRIGLAMEQRYPLSFELWHNGVPLPPSDYIIFS